jgi:hypothetical protein
MIKAILPVILAACFATTAMAQTDSLRIEILKYDDSKTEVITRGRRLLLDKFLEGDKKKVQELLDFLVKEEDKNYLALYAPEKWLLYYWTSQYNAVLSSIQGNDSDFVSTVYNKVRPPQDILYLKLKEIMQEERPFIKSAIRLSDLNATDKDFLVLNLEYLLQDSYNTTQRETLNQSANAFLSAHPNSVYTNYVRKFIRYELTPSKWGFGVEFFTGYGLFTDKLDYYFKRNIPIGVAFDVAYKNWTLFLRDYIGFSKTKVPIAFLSGTWEEGAQARVYLPEATVGYVVFDKRFLRVIPFAGISGTSVAPTEYDKNRIQEYENVGLDFTTTYTAGLSLDLKLGGPKTPGGSIPREQSFWFTRVRYAYNKLRFDNKYGGFGGNLHYITIGLGGFGRTVKRKY